MATSLKIKTSLTKLTRFQTTRESAHFRDAAKTTKLSLAFAEIQRLAANTSRCLRATSRRLDKSSCNLSRSCNPFESESSLLRLRLIVRQVKSLRSVSRSPNLFVYIIKCPLRDHGVLGFWGFGVCGCVLVLLVVLVVLVLLVWLVWLV